MASHCSVTMQIVGKSDAKSQISSRKFPILFTFSILPLKKDFHLKYQDKKAFSQKKSFFDWWQHYGPSSFLGPKREKKTPEIGILFQQRFSFFAVKISFLVKKATCEPGVRFFSQKVFFSFSELEKQKIWQRPKRFLFFKCDTFWLMHDQNKKKSYETVLGTTINIFCNVYSFAILATPQRFKSPALFILISQHHGKKSSNKKGVNVKNLDFQLCLYWRYKLFLSIAPKKLKGDSVISPAVRAKYTSNSGRNDAVTL